MSGTQGHWDGKQQGRDAESNLYRQSQHEPIDRPIGCCGSRPRQKVIPYVERLKAHVLMFSAEIAWSQRPQCPFLTNELCAIHAVRPTVCRKAHALDMKKCRASACEIPQNLSVVVGVAAPTEGMSDA